MEDTTRIIIRCFVLTCIIFILGFGISHVMDSLREETIEEDLGGTLYSLKSYTTELYFYESLGVSRCFALEESFNRLKDSTKIIKQDLSSFGAQSVLNEERFEQLLREYYLSQFKIYLLLSDLNQYCGHHSLPVLLFFDAEDPASARQGSVLEEIEEEESERLTVLPFEVNIKEDHTTQTLIDYFNVSVTPTMILGDEKIEGAVFKGEMLSRVRPLIYPADPYANVQWQNISTQNLSEAERILVEGRITGNYSMICSSLTLFDAVNGLDLYAKAHSYEAIASIDCGRNKRAFMAEAARAYESIGREHRARILRALSVREDPNIKFANTGRYIKGNTSALAARKGNYWLAMDDTGVFSLTVLDELLRQPTTHYLQRDIAVIA